MDKLIAFMWKLVARRFWGEITIKWQDGKPVHMFEGISHDTSKWS